MLPSRYVFKCSRNRFVGKLEEENPPRVRALLCCRLKLVEPCLTNCNVLPTKFEPWFLQLPDSLESQYEPSGPYNNTSTLIRAKEVAVGFVDLLKNCAFKAHVLAIW